MDLNVVMIVLYWAVITFWIMLKKFNEGLLYTIKFLFFTLMNTTLFVK